MKSPAKKNLRFELNDNEMKNLEKFDQHRCAFKKPFACGAAGGRLTFSFVGTGIGTLVTVKCACGKEKDITDISEW